MAGRNPLFHENLKKYGFLRKIIHYFNAKSEYLYWAVGRAIDLRRRIPVWYNAKSNYLNMGGCSGKITTKNSQLKAKAKPKPSLTTKKLSLKRQKDKPKLKLSLKSLKTKVEPKKPKISLRLIGFGGWAGFDLRRVCMVQCKIGYMNMGGWVTTTSIQNCFRKGVTTKKLTKGKSHLILYKIVQEKGWEGG